MKDSAFWDFVADAFDPLACVALAVWSICRFGTGKRLVRHSLVSALAILSTAALANSDKVFSGLSRIAFFPSSHMAFFVAAGVCLAFADPRSLLLSVPAAGFYAWLIAAMGYHTPPEIVSAFALAIPICAGFFLAGRLIWPEERPVRRP